MEVNKTNETEYKELTRQAHELWRTYLSQYYQQLEEFWKTHGQDWLLDTTGISSHVEDMSDYCGYDELDELCQLSFLLFCVSENLIHLEEVK
jgi:hypothetical protein